MAKEIAQKMRNVQTVIKSLKKMKLLFNFSNILGSQGFRYLST
jgi:hypothetical protein